MSELAETGDFASIAKQLENLATKALIGDLSFAWISDGTADEALSVGTNHFLTKLSNLKACLPSAHNQRSLSGHMSNKTALVMPFSTNFVGKVIQADPFNVAESANLAILARIIRSKYLHREIREKNGAYGGGASYSAYDGLFSFYSYRDPNPKNSLLAMENSLHWLDGNAPTEQDLLEAKLSVFSSLDAPLDVSSDGLALFKYGITDLERQEYRDALFAVNTQTLMLAAQKYLSGLNDRTVVICEDLPKLHEELAAHGFTVSRSTAGLLSA